MCATQNAQTDDSIIIRIYKTSLSLRFDSKNMCMLSNWHEHTDSSSSTVTLSMELWQKAYTSIRNSLCDFIKINIFLFRRFFSFALICSQKCLSVWGKKLKKKCLNGKLVNVKARVKWNERVNTQETLWTWSKNVWCMEQVIPMREREREIDFA